MIDFSFRMTPKVRNGIPSIILGSRLGFAQFIPVPQVVVGDLERAQTVTAPGCYKLDGLHRDLTFERGANGKPRIVERRDDQYYLVLSARPRSYVHDESSVKTHILAPCDQSVSTFCFAKGGDKQGYCWDEVIVRVKPGDVFMTRKEYDGQSWTTCYLARENSVIMCGLSDFRSEYEFTLQDVGQLERRDALENGLQIQWRDILTGKRFDFNDHAC